MIPTENQMALAEAPRMELAPPTPMSMIAHALTNGATMEQLEKLMALQERWEANEAKKQFTAAMAAFKADPPEINKDKLVSYSNTKYRHATLGNVCALITAGLAEHGISHSWKTEQADGKITVVCTLTHSAGHSESNSLTSAADTSGSKNAIQAIGSAITYLQRYTLLAATGLATMETDDDGATTATRQPRPTGDPFNGAKSSSAPVPTWQELYPHKWGDEIEGSTGCTFGEIADGDEGESRMRALWRDDPANSALCAWGATWIQSAAKRVVDFEWDGLAAAAILPDCLEHCNPRNLRDAAGTLARWIAAQEKQEGGAE